MDFQQCIRDRINNALFGSNERNVLRVLLGEISTKKSSEVEIFLRNLMKTNDESLRRMRRKTKEVENIQLEQTILQSILGE